MRNAEALYWMKVKKIILILFNGSNQTFNRTALCPAHKQTLAAAG